MCTPRILSAAALGAVVLGSALTAQTGTDSADPNRFIPENSSLVLRVASPAKWRERFGRTQAAKLMSAETLSPMIAGLAETMDEGMQQLRDSGMFDATLLEGLLNDWHGDIVIALQIDLEAAIEAVQFGDVPPFSFVLALTADGQFDLASVAAEFDRMVEKTKPDSGALRDLTVGDLTVRCTNEGGEKPEMALPTMIDGNLVMFAGMDLDNTAARLIGKDDRFAGKTDGSPLFLQLDLGQFMEAVMTVASETGGPVDPRDMLEMLGLGAFGAMTLRLDADEERVTGEMHLALKEQGRGLLRMLTASQQPPRLLRSVPVNADSFSVSSLDMRPVYDTVEDIWQSMEEMVPMTFEDVMQAFAEATKVRLKEDLLDHLGTELLALQDVEALANADFGALEDNPAAMLAGTVYGIALRDGKAFGESLETALRSRGLHAGRKREDYGSVQVNRMRLAGLVEVEYVVTDDLLLIGVGGDEGSQRALRSVLDKRAAGDTDLPDLVQKQAASLPPGWNGIAVTPIAASIEGVFAAMQATGEMPEEMAMFEGMVRSLSQDMKRLGIGTMLSATYVDDKGISSRFRW